VIFKTNCVLCHGIHGDGKGRAAALFNPAPADLTRSDKTDEYKRLIIKLGGEGLRRSQGMPRWAERLSNREIEDVVDYLRTIVIVPKSS
jgi:cytochrome c oxidase cbb3-type subunit III